MPRYELGDESFEFLRSPLPDRPVSSELTEFDAAARSNRMFSEVFAEDYRNFNTFQESIVRQTITDNYPEDSKYLTEVERHGFDYMFMWLATLKQHGYPLHISDNAPILFGVPSVRVGAERESAAELEIFRSGSSTFHPLDKLLIATCSFARSPKRLRTDGIMEYFGTEQDILPEHSGKERQIMLARGYLTALLFRESNSRKLEAVDQQAYVDFRQQGITPFNGEQLYGMMESVVRHNLGQL